MAIPEHQLKELNMKIDSALQVVFQSAAFMCVCVREGSRGGVCSCRVCATHSSEGLGAAVWGGT